MAAGFLSHYLSGPLPYVRCHITVNKNVLSALLNETKFFCPLCPMWYTEVQIDLWTDDVFVCFCCSRCRVPRLAPTGWCSCRPRHQVWRQCCRHQVWRQCCLDTRFGVNAADTKNMSEESRQILHDLQLELNHSKRFHSVPAGAHNSQPFCECLHKVDESLSFWLLKYCLKSPF